MKAMYFLTLDIASGYDFTDINDRYELRPMLFNAISMKRKPLRNFLIQYQSEETVLSNHAQISFLLNSIQMFTLSCAA